MTSESQSEGGGPRGDASYHTYPQRWLVLLTVTLLTLSNNALWISYAAVAPVAAEYFDKDVNTEIDLLSTVSFYVGIPMCLVATYVVDALGFRLGLFPSVPPLPALRYFPRHLPHLCRRADPGPQHHARPPGLNVPGELSCQH
jgi:hypothetical protein